MPYAVELLFDEEGEARVRRIWEALKAAGLSAYMVESGSIPHITLAVYDSLLTSNTVNLSRIDEIRFCKRLGEFAARWAPFTVNFVSIGAFPQSGGTVFLTPTPSEDLLMIHGHFHCSFDDFEANEWEYYKPPFWFPHCTLSTSAEDSAVPEVIRLVLERFRPFPVEIAAASLVRFQSAVRVVESAGGAEQDMEDIQSTRSLLVDHLCTLQLGTGEKHPRFLGKGGRPVE